MLNFQELSVNMGILSLQENGNTLLTSSAMESMKIKCVAEIDKNLPSLAGDAALVSDILSHTCPNDCSGNGQCVDGKNIVFKVMVIVKVI